MACVEWISFWKPTRWCRLCLAAPSQSANIGRMLPVFTLPLISKHRQDSTCLFSLHLSLLSLWHWQVASILSNFVTSVAVWPTLKLKSMERRRLFLSWSLLPLYHSSFSFFLPPYILCSPHYYLFSSSFSSLFSLSCYPRQSLFNSPSLLFYIIFSPCSLFVFSLGYSSSYSPTFMRLSFPLFSVSSFLCTPL